jgi:hypothetical protein
MKRSIAKTVYGGVFICGAIFFIVGTALGITPPNLLIADIVFFGFGIWMVVSGIRGIRKARA